MSVTRESVTDELIRNTKHKSANNAILLHYDFDKYLIGLFIVAGTVFIRHNGTIGKTVIYFKNRNTILFHNIMKYVIIRKKFHKNLKMHLICQKTL